jgi:hypothetical protein
MRAWPDAGSISPMPLGFFSTLGGWSSPMTYDYGEARYRVFGDIDGGVFTVVYTPRGGHFRLISARKASKREVRLYGASAREA